MPTLSDILDMGEDVPERPVKICPTCTMQLPATGVCDECA